MGQIDIHGQQVASPPTKGATEADFGALSTNLSGVLHCRPQAVLMKGVISLNRSSTGDKPEARTTETRLQDLLARYGTLLRRTIVRVCPRAMGLSYDDIEQEARVRLWSALKHEREITHPGSYIYKVAVSATIRAIRRARARREEPLVHPATDADANANAAETLQANPDMAPDVIAERREWIRKIESALSRLQPNRRVAVGLHLQGMTTREIAALLEWTEPKARNLVHRGLKDLRRELRAEGLEDPR